MDFLNLEIIISILFLISYFIELYLDVRSNKFKTVGFIVLTDIIKIAALIGLIYLSFTNIELLWERKMNMQKCGSLMVIMVPIKGLLESDRFAKNLE